MSKQVKNLIDEGARQPPEGLDGVAVINPRGIDAIKNNLHPPHACARRGCG